MIARLPGFELGWVKRIARVPVFWMELIPEREILGVPQPLILAPVQVLVAFVSLVPEVLLPMKTLAQWWVPPRLLGRGAQVLGAWRPLLPWVAVQIDREVGRECGLVVVEWEQEGVSVRISLVDYAYNQKVRKVEKISVWKWTHRAI